MAGKRVINIDEANLSKTNFVRQAWQIRGKTLRPFKNPLIAAVDNLGASYFSVSQTVNNSRTFSTFLQRLVLILDAEDPDWRDETILVLDGALTHRSEETRRAMAALKVPVMIAGPYGFDGSPCEKLFALLKVGELNPDDIKTGKR